MLYNIKIVKIKNSYCDFLRKYDTKVSYNGIEKNKNNLINLSNPQNILI